MEGPMVRLHGYYVIFNRAYIPQLFSITFFVYFSKIY